MLEVWDYAPPEGTTVNKKGYDKVVSHLWGRNSPVVFQTVCGQSLCTPAWQNSGILAAVFAEATHQAWYSGEATTYSK